VSLSVLPAASRPPVDGVLQVAADGTVRTLDRTAAELLGLSVDGLVGTRLGAALPPQGAAVFAAICLNVYYRLIVGPSAAAHARA